MVSNIVSRRKYCDDYYQAQIYCCQDQQDCSVRLADSMPAFFTVDMHIQAKKSAHLGKTPSHYLKTCLHLKIN